MNRRRYLAPWRRAAAATRVMPDGGAGGEVLEALEGKPALYHCISRVVDHTFRLGPEEKEGFVRILGACAEFSQVRVLTFCAMSNHFHVLVEVPERPPEDPGEEELLGILGCLYSSGQVAEIREELERYRRQGFEERAEGLRQRFLRRMWDLSAFMKVVKQRYTRWFNRRHGRSGCLWDDRFKSILVEDGHAARVVAAYIDLNPVRAGIVAQPEQYRWSGYGQAVAGGRAAREGLRQVMLEGDLDRGSPESALRESAGWKQVEGRYRVILFEAGRKTPGEVDAAHGGGRGRWRGIGSREADAVVAARGRMGEAEMLGQRVRYFTDGLVVGGQTFVDGVFQLTKDRFSAGRTSGARRMSGVDTLLRTMRDLRVRALGTKEQ